MPDLRDDDNYYHHYHDYYNRNATDAKHHVHALSTTINVYAVDTTTDDNINAITSTDGNDHQRSRYYNTRGGNNNDTNCRNNNNYTIWTSYDLTSTNNNHDIDADCRDNVHAVTTTKHNNNANYNHYWLRAVCEPMGRPTMQPMAGPRRMQS